ncbi:MAG: hypothetical protein ACI87F_000105, partial [Candidatus Azotimanducaceae bacterium]
YVINVKLHNYTVDAIFMKRLRKKKLPILLGSF